MNWINILSFFRTVGDTISSCWKRSSIASILRKENNELKESDDIRGPIQTRNVDYFIDESLLSEKKPVSKANDKVVVKIKDVSLISLYSASVIIIAIVIFCIGLSLLSYKCHSSYEKQQYQQEGTTCVEKAQEQRSQFVRDSIFNVQSQSIINKLDSISNRIENVKINIKIQSSNK